MSQKNPLRPAAAVPVWIWVLRMESDWDTFFDYFDYSHKPKPEGFAQLPQPFWDWFS